MITMTAYAKLNLSLEVLGKRPDGYHEVFTILQTITLADDVTLEHGDVLRLVCDAPDLADEANMALRAAQALRTASGYAKGAMITLRKRIPVAAGLGGGSTDAAATLLGLNRLWGLGLSLEALTPIAAALGSDVPFFLTGGTALATGRGEQITTLPPLPTTPFVLVHPPLHLEQKTARMYGLMGRAHYSDGTHTRQVVDLIRRGVFQERMAHNVFDTVGELAFPELGGYIRALTNAGGWFAHLAGAGPTLFATMRSPEEATAVAGTLRRQGFEAYAVESVTPSSSQSTLRNEGSAPTPTSPT